MFTPLGFSVAQTSVTGWPAWTDSGCALKLTIRAGGTIRCGRACVPGAAGDGAWPGSGVGCTAATNAAIVSKWILPFTGLDRYDLIIRPSGNLIREASMAGSPLFAAPPVQEMTSPGFTVSWSQPYDFR
jgi:hypothetical protein